MGCRVHAPLIGVIALVVGAAGASAQTSVPPIAMRPGVGAMGGAVVTADRNAAKDGGTMDLAVNVEVPVASRLRLRGEFGRARWTFDGNDGMATPLAPEKVGLTRFTAAAVVALESFHGIYAGGGAGVYRYSSGASPVPRPVRPGLHALAGTEFPLHSSGLAMRLEGLVQAVGGPNEAAAPGDLQPFAEPRAGRSRVFSEVLFNFALGVGVAWRF